MWNFKPIATHLAKQKQSTLQSYIGLYTGLICCSLYSPSMHPTCENTTSFHTKLVISLLVWVSDIYNYLFVLVRLQFGVKWGDVSTCHVHARWKYRCRHIFQEKECFIVSHSRQFENRGRLTHPLCKLSIQLDSQELCWFLKKHGTSQRELSVQIFSWNIPQHCCWYYAISRHHMFTKSLIWNVMT